MNSSATRPDCEGLVRAGRRLDALGYCPATSGNYSTRWDAGRFLVTVSGADKGRLTAEDFVAVSLNGEPLDPGRKPSAEASLHALMFRLDAAIGAVLHTHSVHSTVLGMALPGAEELEIHGYEMQKALPGVTTHDGRVRLAIFDNSQDVERLAHAVEERWRRGPAFAGFLLRGHGLYGWGRDVAAALTAVEALEFLVSCELEKRRLR